MISIDSALETFADRLNQNLKTVSGMTEDLVALTNIVEPDGSPNIRGANKIVVQLCSIAAITSARNRTQPVGFAGSQAFTSLQLPLELQVMIVANFTGTAYVEGLKLISHVITFLEQSSDIDAINTPGLADGIGSMQLIWDNLALSDTHAIMEMLGVKYLPSIFCKIRVAPAESGGAPVIAGR